MPATRVRIIPSPLRLPAWFIGSPARYIGLIIATVLSQWALFRADVVFEGISGYPTLDTQNDLTVDAAVEQIRSYTPQAVEAYELFAVLDYVFPLVASILLSANLLWLVRFSNRRTSWRIPEWVAVIGLLPVVFDFTENIFLASAVTTDGSAALLTVAIAAKKLKLLSLVVASSAQLIALLYAIVVVIARGRGRKTGTTPDSSRSGVPSR
ncbi:MAG: hypothetical protein V4531_13450 [Actinomycetota bacterium]